MPVHDGAAWLKPTLNSVLAAEPDGIEFIAIDSSASDEGADILTSYAGWLDLKLHRRPDLKPWTTKTNMGVDMARARHVTMLHQDDLWRPNRAEQVRNWLDAFPNAALHLAATDIVDASGAGLGQWRCPLPAGPVDGAFLLERLLVQNFISVPAPVIRRDAWLEVGGIDDALWYTGDWDLWLKLAGAGEIVNHDVVTTGFRVHGGSLTTTGSRAREEFEGQMSSVLERHLHRLPTRSLRMVDRPARASILVNSALADAAGGDRRALLRALAALFRLGPFGLWRYWHCSRIGERALPRLRAKLAGAL